MMVRKQFSLTERQRNMLVTLSAYLQLSESEIVRRIFDRGLPEELKQSGLRSENIGDMDIDMDKTWFTREEVDRIMQADGRPWLTGLSTSTGTR